MYILKISVWLVPSAMQEKWGGGGGVLIRQVLVAYENTQNILIFQTWGCHHGCPVAKCQNFQNR